MDELSAVLKARSLVSKLSSNTVPVPVEAYAAVVGAEIRLDDSLGPNEPGWSFTKSGKHYICINKNDRKERQRFTACHEIAHIVLGLPSDHAEQPWWSYAKRSPDEILCDVFAAELLLPFNVFKSFVNKADIGLASVDALAARFEASVTATGSRFAAVAGSPCAFILAEGGVVRYASRSATLRDGKAWIAPRMALPAGSLCARLHAGETFTSPEEISADTWFAHWDRGGVLLEDARHLAQWNQTVALLWFDDEELPPAQTKTTHERQEEEQGLAELDGTLPWPGKKRRR